MGLGEWGKRYKAKQTIALSDMINAGFESSFNPKNKGENISLLAKHKINR